MECGWRQGRVSSFVCLGVDPADEEGVRNLGRVWGTFPFWAQQQGQADGYLVRKQVDAHCVHKEVTCPLHVPVRLPSECFHNCTLLADSGWTQGTKVR